MTDLVLGPLLRWVDRDHATVWVEVDAPCTVDVLGATAPTFEVAGHHFALVEVDLADRGEVTPYEVRVDGVVLWPRPDDEWPAPVIRRPATDRTVVVFGSCRAAAPDEEPWTLPRAEHPRGMGIDALEEYAARLATTDHADWPDLLLMLGDQVYADAASPETRAYARRRRDTSRPPGEEVADFEEYTRLYRESWTDPEIRWLLSTVPTAMMFDDHDIIDDWNISASWLEDMRATEWWHDRIVGGLVAYWCYQHLGNLSPDDLATDPVVGQVRDRAGDAAPVLWRFAEEADRDPTTVRWSFHRHLAETDLVVLDTRAARVLDGERDMLDEDEWRWLADRLAAPARHVLVASTLPVLLPGAIHDVEGWNERLGDGAWGGPGRWAGEHVRRAIDLEHWAAFGTSFDRLLGLLHDVVADPGVETVALLAGDVHYGQVDRATWADLDQPMWQVVASPMRQEVEPLAARAFALARSPWGRTLGWALRRLSGGQPPALSWETVEGPVLDNHVARVEAGPDGVHVTVLASRRTPGLATAIERWLR
jgi:hypothetical protein